MPADRMDADRECSGYFFARRTFVYEVQNLFFPDGQYFCVMLFAQFGRLPIDGIDYQTFGWNVEWQRAIKA